MNNNKRRLSAEDRLAIFIGLCWAIVLIGYILLKPPLQILWKKNVSDQIESQSEKGETNFYTTQLPEEPDPSYKAFQKSFKEGNGHRIIASKDTEESIESKLFYLQQEIRKKANLPLFVPDDILRYIARMHSQDMALHNYFSHNDKQGLSHAERIRIKHRRFFGLSGENIYLIENLPDIKGREEYLAKEIATALMNSPGHRKNILHPGFNRIGIGLYHHISNKRLLVTLLFADSVAMMDRDAPEIMPLNPPLSFSGDLYPKDLVVDDSSINVKDLQSGKYLCSIPCLSSDSTRFVCNGEPKLPFGIYGFVFKAAVKRPYNQSGTIFYRIYDGPVFKVKEQF